MNTECRKVLDLRGLWQFRIDKRNLGEKNGWFRRLAKADLLYVPASWNEQNHEYLFYEGIGWYWRSLILDEVQKEKMYWLCFDAVNYHAKVWFNGEAVGEHTGGYTKFRLPVKPKVGINSIAVRVDNSLSAQTVPTAIEGDGPHFDFVNYGGIHRGAWLETTPKAYVDDLTITTTIHKQKADIACAIELRNHGSVCPGLLSGEIFCENKVVGRFEHSVELPKGVYEQNVVVSIKSPKVWCPNSPNLYLLRLSVTSDYGTDRLEQVFGIRQFKLSNGRLYLNGKRVFWKGVSRHEEAIGCGRGIFTPLYRKDYDLMQWLGANSFRTTHYPYAQEDIELADRLGFMVILEGPLVGPRPKSLKSKEFLARNIEMMKEIVKQYKNHPSILMWSVSNEPHSYAQAAGPFFKQLIEHTKQTDPTRPVVMISCHPNDKAITHSDIVCLNRYFGWYVNMGDVEGAKKSLSEELDKYYKQFKKPIMLTEFGGGAKAGYHSLPAQMWSEEYQAQIIQALLSVACAKEYVVGVQVWGLTDFRTFQGTDRMIFNHKGLFTRDRQPKAAAFALKAFYESL